MVMRKTNFSSLHLVNKNLLSNQNNTTPDSNGDVIRDFVNATEQENNYLKSRGNVDKEYEDLANEMLQRMQRLRDGNNIHIMRCYITISSISRFSLNTGISFILITIITIVIVIPTLIHMYNRMCLNTFSELGFVYNISVLILTSHDILFSIRTCWVHTILLVIFN